MSQRVKNQKIKNKKKSKLKGKLPLVNWCLFHNVPLGAKLRKNTEIRLPGSTLRAPREYFMLFFRKCHVPYATHCFFKGLVEEKEANWEYFVNDRKYGAR